MRDAVLYCRETWAIVFSGCLRGLRREGPIWKNEINEIGWQIAACLAAEDQVPGCALE